MSEGDAISREAAVRDLEELKALHEQNAAISSGESKYAYGCYAAATDHAIHNLKQLPSLPSQAEEMKQACIEALVNVVKGWRSDLDESWDERPDLSFEAADKIAGVNEILTALQSVEVK